MLLALLLIGFSRTPAAAQPPVTSPCADSLYQVLRGKPLQDLSEREYAYFMQREKACTEYQQLNALVNRPANAAPRTNDRPLTSETRSQGSPHGGADIFVRNTSDRPLIVNSINIYDCVNLRAGACGMQYPKMVIQPGQERRVYTIRYGSESLRSSYRYNYNISGVSP
jgi:hypothetical protein